MQKRKSSQLFEPASPIVSREENELIRKITAKIDYQMESSNTGSKEIDIRALKIPKQRFEFGTLSNEQNDVLSFVIKECRSIFFTGAAGTGKSFLLKVIVQTLTDLGLSDSTFITGSTGIAACNIGGVTVHSFAGVGLGNETMEEMLTRVMQSSHSKKRWRKCKILILDEISMLDGRFFEKLSIIGSRVRGNPRPFGGIQLICCGDFFQLPPVGIGQGGATFCFEAPCWSTAITHNVILSKPFRQREDQFITLLNDIRTGQPSKKTLGILAQRAKASRSIICHNQEEGVQAVVATKLFSRNRDVNQTNAHELAKLPGKPIVYHCEDSGDERLLGLLQKHSQAVSKLELKVGSQVMLLKNLDMGQGLVNGARGVVVDFKQYRTDEPEEGDDEKYQTWGVLPVVEFNQKGNLRRAMALPQEWSVQAGGCSAARTQVPLRCAWSISIHKSQGMTISALEVDLAGCFEYGQAYVALSRASSLTSLWLTNFNPKCIRAHKKVVDFYQSLESSSRLSSSNQSSWKCPGMTEKDEEGWIDCKCSTKRSSFNDITPTSKVVSSSFRSQNSMILHRERGQKTKENSSNQDSSRNSSSLSSKLREPQRDNNLSSSRTPHATDSGPNSPSSSDVKLQNRARVLALMASKGRNILY